MQNSDVTSWSFQTDPVHDWAYWEKLFTDQECDEIIKICKSKKLSIAEVKLEKEIDLNYRKSNIVFVGPNNLDWVFRRLTDVCMSLNDRFFGFDLWGFSEGLQFTEYKSSGSKYDDHIDRSCNGVIRKLSVVIQLTDPKKYKGCDLELITSMTPNKMSRERGHLVVFPSYILHRVTPLERGTRHSLVGWVTGKPFK